MAAVSGRITTLPFAVAVRVVIGFAVTSTIRAFPLGSKWFDWGLLGSMGWCDQEAGKKRKNVASHFFRSISRRF
jgi:hypothetical protein